MIKCLVSSALSLLLVFVISFAGNGQDLAIGAVVGANLTSINTPDATYKPGFHYGGFTRLIINEQVGVQLELIYNAQLISMTK